MEDKKKAAAGKKKAAAVKKSGVSATVRAPAAVAKKAAVKTVAKRKAPAASAPVEAAQSAAARSAQARQNHIAQAFSQIVAVLMRDPIYRSLTLADLEWLVLPAVMAGQFRIAHATTQSEAGKAPQSGMMVPVAVALWARVSPAVDKVLCTDLEQQMRLRNADWVSGDIPWLIAAAGHPRALPAFLKQLAERDFKGQPVKMRLREADGKVVVKALGAL